ncbi:hypothetical protein [Salinibacter ruber]|jgi:hypothetical protein|uniref:hypothetical protein n=1 Tax=Salinibacter ruber TaxID=146919 RepID=UPI0020736CE8|nr:hypothetical protein [Salinibacter ruber]MCS3856550.1 hypothetical protein [Salinibacter ruber]MCS4198181.1 hypothetical protein [Salinibacter ruber]
MRDAVFLIVAILFVGCATTKSVSVDKRTQTYDAPKEQVYNAVISSYTEYGFGIQNSNMQSGVVTSSYKVTSGMRAALTGTYRLRYNAVVRGDSTQSRVRLTITAQQKSLGGWQAANMTGSDAEKLYKQAFASISQKVSN